MTAPNRKNTVPADLRKVLNANKKTETLWQSLTPVAQRDFISWIESAKQPETRKKRVTSIPSRLTSGKRRPCCYAIVPMHFYKALGESPKAKVTWKSLSPDDRRDLIAWIESSTGSADRAQRVARVCTKLALGKKHL